MRAIICNTLTGFEALSIEDVPAPTMGSTRQSDERTKFKECVADVRIKVHAAGLNFADTLVTQGKYQIRPPLPFTPGLEVAGEVVEVADGVSNVKVGDRVMALVAYGGYAEEVVAPHSTVYKISPQMDWSLAAGFPIVYGTSYVALVERARLQPGEVLLVHGAAGGVGLSAVEIGKRLGATVIATAGGPDKLAIAEKFGADYLIDYKSEDVRERVLAITEGLGFDGAHVVYDPVGGALFDASLRCTVSGGRILLVGFASGTVPQIPANIMLVKNLDIMGIYFGAMRMADPAMVQTAFEKMMTWYEQGALRPHVSATYPLEEAIDALRMLAERRSTGKVVLTAI